jgi:hypothetical protein
VINLNNFDSPTVKKPSRSDGYSAILKEAYEYFSESNIDMVSGYSEILSEDALFNEYVNRLTKGLDADETAQIHQILENQRLVTLQESTVNQISPISGLAMPTVRKMWSKTALKNAIPTETAKVPAFTISWMSPYLRTPDGTKHQLPKAVRNQNDLDEQPKVYGEEIAIPTEVGANLFELTLGEGGKEAAKINNDAINPKIKIHTVTLTVPTDDGETTKEVVVNAGLNVSNMFNVQVEEMSAHTNPADRVKVTDQLIGSLNCETGDFTMMSAMGKITGFTFYGTLTHENNMRGDSVSFDIEKKDIRIGTGAHLQAPLPIEFLQDTLALYNIDATVESVDLMSQVTAQKLDLEIIKFFDDSFVTSGSPYVGAFDVKPSAGFAGSPTEWRKEIRTIINWWADKLKTSALFSEGYFVIYGNPLDINIIPDINWQFRAVGQGTQGERGGVTINYDFGVMTFNNIFQVVSSDNVPQGELTMFFVPTTDKYMTYKYYPYTFNIEKGGYINNQMPNVPSILMTKRHTIEELIPMQVKIKILNNNGKIISNYALGGMAGMQ